MTRSAIAIDECAESFRAAMLLTFPTTQIRWAGIEESTPPPSTLPWFRWAMQHTESAQASLSCEHGERRWRRNGMIFVQCFAPLDKGGVTLAQRMAESARAVYEGTSTPSGVWFRDASTMEVGMDRAWFQVNAFAQFTYDDVR